MFLFTGLVICLLIPAEAGSLKRSHRKRALTQQQKLDEVLNQQLLKYDQFLIEQQTQLEMAKQEQLRQLQESQVQLFRQQQQQESFIADYQANLNQQKIAQINQNHPPGPTVAELRADTPVIAEDAALGGANSNTRRKIEHDLKIEQQLRFEEAKAQILHQQKLQIDAMNTQNQIQAETRSDQQDAFIESKLQIENQQAQQREQLYALIESQREERREKARRLQELIDNGDYEYDEYVEPNTKSQGSPKFARLLQGEERQAKFEEETAQRQERYLRIQQERLARRKDEQVRQAQKLQQILHETQETQEAFEKNYQAKLEDYKHEQLAQSKKIQEQLHQTQRQLEAQEEHQHGVMVAEYNAQAVDQATRNQKLIIQQHQERVRLQHKIQQNHRLTQDMDHANTKEDIELQQSKQKDHMHNQHSIQYNERMRQKLALENLRNQLRSQIEQLNPAKKDIVEEIEVQSEPTINNPETVYLEPRFFLAEAQPVEPVNINNKKNSLVLPETKTVTITTVEEPVEEPVAGTKNIVQTKKELTVSVTNKTIEISCADKIDGMYRNENDCNSYYVCTESQLYTFDCPAGTSFNMEHCTCDWPTESTECIIPLVKNECSINKKESGTKSESVPSESEVETSEEQWAPFSCNNKEKGFYRDPVDCTKFYYCEIFNKPAPLKGQTVIKNDFFCPNNFHFDVFSCKCGQPTSNSCSNYALTTYCTHSS